jgi:hypothetical protein
MNQVGLSHSAVGLGPGSLAVLAGPLVGLGLLKLFWQCCNGGDYAHLRPRHS